MKGTLVAVAVGSVVGVALALANIMMALKIGLWDTGTLTGALLAFAVCRPLLKALGTAFTAEDNNLAQAVSTATGTMPAAAGLMAALPALQAAGHSLSIGGVFATALIFGVYGTLLGVVLAPSLLEAEQLPFPSGLATAELIGVLHGQGDEAARRLKPFLAGLGAAALVAVLRDGAQVIPQELGVTVTIGAIGVLVGAAASPMLVGAGMLVGGRVGLSVLGGGLLAWLGGAAWAQRQGGLDALTLDALAAWVRWPGVALLLGAVLLPVVLLLPLVRGKAGDASQPGVGWRLKAGTLAAALAVLVLMHGLYGLSWSLALVSVLVGAVLTIAVARSAGLTDIAPLGDVAQLSQLGGALMADKAGGLASAHATAGPAAYTTSMLLTLRSGQRLKVRKGPQVLAQLVGVVVGAVVVAPLWPFIVGHWVLGSAQLPAPNAARWTALAEVLEKGLSALPHGALEAAVVCGVVGLAFSVLERTRLNKWLPSATGVGLGFLVPLSASLALGLGAVAGMWAERRPEATRERALAVLVSAAAGFITGDTLTSVAVALVGLAG